MIKPIGPACNLACRYCYYPQGETPVRKMDDATLESFIRRYIAAQPAGAREINFVWQGGEPLLAGLRFYQKALALQQRYAPRASPSATACKPTPRSSTMRGAACSVNIISRSASVWKAVKRCKTTTVRINAARPATRRRCAASPCCTGIRWNLIYWWWSTTR
ncbi:hypothetical protein DMB90_16185 [Raoultella planticola]|uniref:Radical SAM core domain-containing protein n=1 Tax=Raoultella planticola TaxID=575 RepID=A0A5P6AAF5_RAOPL|nr:hypothetical protein DMB90_16185 [Raoultella planticola]